MSSPSPKSPEQSDKIRKYDRQLRLWGEHGQRNLEAATVCLVNATAVGCETLKSLVLPGVGGFTIADGTVVVEDDIGINFFLDPNSIGQSKAAACKHGLQEMNSDVRGDYVDESIDYILTNRPSFLKSFDLVIASNMNEKSLVLLSSYLWDANIPFIYCRSLGFYGSVRVQLKEHCVIEAHPENTHYDLRLNQPFSALQNYLENTTITPNQPWLIVMYKYLQEWRRRSGNRLPANYREKCELRALIEEAIAATVTAASSKNERLDSLENYHEAVHAVNTAFGGGVVSSNIAALFNDDSCVHLTKESDPFWIMVRSLKEFVENENSGMLPLVGRLPDMSAATESYINLQNIYRQQALHNADAVYRICQCILKRLGLPEDMISQQQVSLLCREAGNLHVVRGSKLADEYGRSSQLLINADESEMQGSLTELYIGLRAYDRFQSEYGSKPGECYAENDTARLKTISNKLLHEWGFHTSMSDDLIHEICHYGGAEIHSVSAFIGGCVAHEAIKLLTQQYKPLDNMFLYNGITTESTSMRI